MSVADEFDAWAAAGRDRGMERRHWHTAKHCLARMPVEPGDVVLDLGCGSGYAGRALRGTRDAGRVYGLDGSPEMLANARSYTDDDAVGYVRGDFDALPFADDAIDHCFSMEAFYYAPDPAATLAELRRVLRPGGGFHCAVNYFTESVHTADWGEGMAIDLTRWSAPEYRRAFREAGLAVASQSFVPDRERTIPPAEAFPTDDWERRSDVRERYREWGTLLTVGVAPSP